MQQSFLQSKAQILRRSVRDPVCAPCWVFVFLALLFLNAFRADYIFFDVCVDSVGGPDLSPCQRWGQGAWHRCTV